LERLSIAATAAELTAPNPAWLSMATAVLPSGQIVTSEIKAQQ
jgi:hypothetical protein